MAFSKQSIDLCGQLGLNWPIVTDAFFFFQGLAEVVGGLGVDKMNAVMPDIIKHSERTDLAPHVKDGYIMMFIYMPSVFPEEFTKYIGQVIWLRHTLWCLSLSGCTLVARKISVSKLCLNIA